MVSDEVVELVVKDLGVGGIRIYKWKHKRPLYLELLKIAQQMVAGASWPNAPFSSRPVESIGREPCRRLPGACRQQLLGGGVMEAGWGGEKRSRLEWSGAGTIFCTA